MNQTRLDLYTDYLTVTFGYATATGLSRLLEGEVSHDAVSRFLSEREYTSKDLWKQVKKTVREVESADGYLKGLTFPVKLARQIFTNQDGSSGILYLVCSKLAAEWDEITATYQKRWKVEVFHKSLKSNAAFAKSPAHTAKTQANHLFASIVAVFKMECLTISKHLNHFALRSKLYAKATRIAFDELQVLRAA